jgi:replicative DNA helicase
MNLNQAKLPPQAIEVEVAILGALLLDVRAYETVTPFITSASFYLERHQLIYKAIETLANAYKPVDLLTVTEELRTQNNLDKIGGPYELIKLTNAVVSSAHVETHAKIVAEKYMLRQLISISTTIIGSAFDESSDPFEVMDAAEKAILNLSTSTSIGGVTDITTVVMDALKKVEGWRKNDGTLTGIPTGFAELDRATRGWQNGDLIIIAARPSGGKTALALNLIRNAALNSTKPVAVGAWSLEMKAVYLVLRMLAAESEIILHKIQTGRLSDAEMDQLIKKGADRLTRAKIYFDENSSVNIRSLKAKARRLKKKNNLGLIVIDYLQLMSGETTKGNREQEISTISRELKNLAQELDVPIIALSQLSREGVKGCTWEVGPPVSALRESGAIEQDADLILMLWGPNESELANDASLDGKRKLRIAKQRNGVLVTVELDFRSEIQLFNSIKTYF